MRKFIKIVVILVLNMIALGVKGQEITPRYLPPIPQVYIGIELTEYQAQNLCSMPLFSGTLQGKKLIVMGIDGFPTERELNHIVKVIEDSTGEFKYLYLSKSLGVVSEDCYPIYSKQSSENYVQQSCTLNVTEPSDTIKRYYEDGDHDGYGSIAVYQDVKIDCGETPPADYILRGGDCNDDDGTISPETIWYYDHDGDGLGNANVTKMQCLQPDRYVSNAEDCNDNDPMILKSCGVYYRDIDQDGLGDPSDYKPRHGDDPTPEGFVTNANDLDIDLHIDHSSDHNYIYSITYDPRTNLTSQGIQYYDEFGMPIQGTTKDPFTKKGWSSVSVTDEFNRPAVSSFGAPVQDNKFLYEEGLLEGVGGDYHYNDFTSVSSFDSGRFRFKDLSDNSIVELRVSMMPEFMNYPGSRMTVWTASKLSGRLVKEVEIIEQLDSYSSTDSWYVEYDKTEEYKKLTQPSGTIPNYYKEGTSTVDPKDRMDVTDYPLTRMVYGIDGGSLKNIGVRKKADGTWSDGYSFTMPAAQEMFYLFGKDYFPPSVVAGFNEEDYPDLIDLLEVPTPRTLATETSLLVEEDCLNDQLQSGDCPNNVYLYTIQFLNPQTCTYADSGMEVAFTELLKTNTLYKIYYDGFLTYFKVYRYSGSVLEGTREVYHAIEMTGGCEAIAQEQYKHALIKTVTIDVEGVENVMFQDLDGNVIGGARSGTKETHSNDRRSMLTMMQDTGYVDLHLPDINSLQIYTKGNITFTVINLKTGERRTGVTQSNLSSRITKPGIYRFEVEDIETFNYYRNTSFTFGGSNQVKPAFESKSIYFTYDVFYYDYAINYYDNAGRLTKSVPPLGVNHPTTIPNSNQNHTMASTFEYNALGQLIKSTSVDEGEAEIKYRKDGQIRYSQNSYQRVNNAYSFTDYDQLARPVKSGVCTGTFSSLDPDASLSRTGCTEISETRYDTADPDLANLLTTAGKDLNDYKQTFVAGNVSMTRNENNRTWYSYDVEGKLKWVAMFIEGLGLKTIDYAYDYRNNVTHVYYQKNEAVSQCTLTGSKTLTGSHTSTTLEVQEALTITSTATVEANAKVEYKGGKGISLKTGFKAKPGAKFHGYIDPKCAAPDIIGVPEDYFEHYYVYDKVSRLQRVKTSTDGKTYTEHAEYIYNDNGSVRRVELAGNLQGIDYTYNIYGQLKAINSSVLGKDPGNDGTGSGQSGFATDVFGLQLDYNAVDYQNQTVKTSFQIGNFTPHQDYYNGNIASQRWQGATTNYNQNIYEYEYQKHTNWLSKAAYGTVSGSTKSLNDAYKVENLTYDKNGNILTLKRNGTPGTPQMDQLTYHYPTGSNQLSHVDDAVSSSNYSDDLDDQAPDNYEYNALGQLVYNKQDGIGYTYYTSGLTKAAYNGKVGDGKKRVEFKYNESGQRIQKLSYNDNGVLLKTTYYVRDAAGTPMAIYTQDEGSSNKSSILAENAVYGSGRLGTMNRITEVTLYEITDHLGNVRAVVGKDANGSMASMVKGSADYYPFGSQFPDRKDLDYRYAYQGQEKDAETGMEAFELRLWDSRIGRWLTPDPYGQHASPYLGMGNNPIIRIDPDGGKDGDPGDGKGIGAIIKGWWNAFLGAFGNKKAVYEGQDAIEDDCSGCETINLVEFSHKRSEEHIRGMMFFADIIGTLMGSDAYARLYLDNLHEIPAKMDVYQVSSKYSKFPSSEGEDMFFAGLPLVSKISFVKAGKPVLSAFVKTEKIAGGAQNLKTIKYFEEAFRSNDVYTIYRKPIHVTVHNGKTYILDGHHRIQAAINTGSDLEIINLPLKDAKLDYPDKVNDIIKGAFD